MLSRRELLRAGTLTGLVVAAPTVFSACSGDRTFPAGEEVDSEGTRLVSSDVARTVAVPAAISAGTGAALALGAGLYGQLVTRPGNLTLSPYSAAVALGRWLERDGVHAGGQEPRCQILERRL